MRKESFKHNLFDIISIVLISSLFIFTMVFFFDIYLRLWDSLKFLGKSIIILFSPLNSDGSAPSPSLEIIVPIDMKEFVYQFKAFSMALINRDVAMDYLFGSIAFLLNLLKYLIWVPSLIASIYLTKKYIILRKRPETIEGDSKALTYFKRFEERFINKAIANFSKFIKHFKKNKVYKATFIVFLLLIFRIIPIGIDLLAWYIHFLRTFDFSSINKVALRIVFDIFIIFYRYDSTLLAISLVIVILIVREKRAKKALEKRQSHNEKISENLSIVIDINGQVFIGKTIMASSLAIDSEMQLRNKAFGIIKKYTKMFPRFPWDKFETDINHHVEQREVVNRAQISKMVDTIFKDIENDPDSPETIYGYDVTKERFSYWNGVRNIALRDAMTSYGEAYFLYSANVALSYANFSIRYNFTREGYFPIYDYYAVYDMSEEEQIEHWNKYYTAVVNFDARRILKHMNNDNRDDWYLMDGQVEVYTEMDKERGNQNDYGGLENDSDYPNQKNDGWNRSVMLTRHEYSIDGIPFTRLIMDWQRTEGVNVGLREAAENKIFIRKKSEPIITLPFFWIDYLLFVPILNWFDKYFFDFRKNRRDYTLYNYLALKLLSIFNKHIDKSTNIFGYYSLAFRHEKGGNEKEPGEKTLETYYIISRKMFSDRYRTDCYRPFFSEPRIKSKKGMLDAPRYVSTYQTADDLSKQNSYLFDEIKRFTYIEEEKIGIRFATKRQDK